MQDPNSPTGILPPQFKAAYGFNRIPAQGQGQTIALVDAYDDSYGGWVEVGGTSLAAPDWASFFTLVNSLRASQGKIALSQAAPDLYTLYYSNNYPTDFHDITSGGCGAGPGYDLATGIGSYQANNLAPALAAEPN